MLAIGPELVEYEAAAPGSCEPLDELIARMREGGVAAVSPNGVLGDPTHADAGHGHYLLQGATAELTQIVAAWSESAA